MPRKRPISMSFWARPATSRTGPARGWPCLRADMALRWEAGEKVGAQWYLDRYPDLGEDTIVALVYEEFCLREEDDEHPHAGGVSCAVSRRLPSRSAACWQIHDLVGSGTPATAEPDARSAHGGRRPTTPIFPEAGQTIARLSSGRGAGARGVCSRFSGQGAPARRSAGGARR